MAGASEQRRKYRLVIVDDQAPLLSLLAALLRDRFDVEAFASPVEALAYLLTDGVLPDVVLCDISMPVLSGPGLARRAIEKRPPLGDAFVFMTGDPNVEASTLPKRSIVLAKPLQLETLADELIAVAARAVSVEREDAGQVEAPATSSPMPRRT